MIEPPVLSLRHGMVLLNNSHYPNVVLPTRMTDHIRNFFNAIDQVVPDVQVEEEEEEEEQDDQDSDSSNAKSESLDLDQPEASSANKSPEDEIMPQAEVVVEEYNRGQ